MVRYPRKISFGGNLSSSSFSMSAAAPSTKMSCICRRWNTGRALSSGGVRALRGPQGPIPGARAASSPVDVVLRQNAPNGRHHKARALHQGKQLESKLMHFIRRLGAVPTGTDLAVL